MHHVHIVDSSGAEGRARVNAATLFAHVTLRCGHLRDVIGVSASTTAATASTEAQQTHTTTTTATHDSADVRDDGAQHRNSSSNGDDDDVQVIKAMEAAVRGGYADDNATTTTTTTATQSASVVRPHGGGVSLPFVASALRVIAPYAYFDTSFAMAEHSLALACATQLHNNSNNNNNNTQKTSRVRYFDLVITADLAAYDAVLQYYMRHATSVTATAAMTHAQSDDNDDDEKATQYTLYARPCVGVAHIVCDDVARVGVLYQQLVEALLVRSNNNNNNNNNSNRSNKSNKSNRTHDTTLSACPPWVAVVDDVVASFAQVLGVDVLITVV